MTAPNHTSIRFSFRTVLVWLLVAGGTIFVLWNVILRISANNMPISTATPNLTQVYQTIAAMLTDQVSTPTPTNTQTVTPSPKAQSTQAHFPTPPTRQATAIPIDISQTNTPMVLCDRAAAGNPLDVTIPDNSEYPPGESFIKTWKLENNGSCTWTKQYFASFFYGDRMEAPEAVPLQGTVQPKQSIEISIEMVAPSSPGTYQGNWMLSNANGDLFGIGPNSDAPFWVRIIVEENEPNTPTPTFEVTPTITPTVTITPTATPEGDMDGTLLTAPGSFIDLDTLTLNTDDEDLIYQVDANNQHWLVPHGETIIGEVGSKEPVYSICQSANMGSDNILVENLPVGTYLCYITGEDRVGRALIVAFDPDTYILTLDLLTWAKP